MSTDHSDSNSSTNAHPRPVPQKVRNLATLATPSPATLLRAVPLPNLSHPLYLRGSAQLDSGIIMSPSSTTTSSSDHRQSRTTYSNNYNLVRDSAYEGVLQETLYHPLWSLDSDKSVDAQQESSHSAPLPNEAHLEAKNMLKSVANLMAQQMKSHPVSLNAYGVSKMKHSDHMPELIKQCAGCHGETSSSKSSIPTPSPLMTQFLKLIHDDQDLHSIEKSLTTTQAAPNTMITPSKPLQEIRKLKYGQTPVVKKRKKMNTLSKKDMFSTATENKENDLHQLKPPAAVPASKRLGNVLGSHHGPQQSSSQMSQSTQQGQVDALEIFLQDVFSFSMFQREHIKSDSRKASTQEAKEDTKHDFHTVVVNPPAATHQNCRHSYNHAVVDHDEDQMDIDQEELDQLVIDPHTMDRLYTEVSRAKQCGILKRVEEEKLKQLLFVFAQLITDTLDSISVGDGNCIESVNEHDRQVSLSLKAAQIALEIMTCSPSSAPSPTIFIIEEVVEAILELLKALVKFFIIPTVQHEHSQSKKRKIFSCNNMMVKICSILNLLFDLIQQVDLKDEFLLRISHLTIGAFFVEGLSKIQLASYKIINFIFSRYPEHRINCLQTIVSSILSLSKKKHVERKFKLENNISVQTFSTLVVQLIQTCAGKPGQLPPEATQSNEIDAELDVSFTNDGEETPTQSNQGRTKNSFPHQHLDKLTSVDKLSDFYRLSQHCANAFLKSFLTQCATSSAGGDSRLIIEHFVDDLLVMIEMPSFPAADMILQVTCKSLYEHILSSTTVVEKYRVGAIQILGKIACACRTIAKTRHDASRKIALKTSLEESFKLLVLESESPFYKTVSSKSTWGTSTHGQLLVHNYLCSEEQPWLPFARQYSVAQWFESDDLKDKHEQYYLSLFNADLEAEFKTASHVPAQFDDVSDAFHYILEKRRVSSINSFDYILHNIIKLLRDDKAKFRSAALKAVKEIVETDYTVIESVDVANAIMERQNDERISVRESVFQLIGSVLEQSAQMLTTTPIFIPMILRGLNDKGVSVRKRCIRILGEIYSFDIPARMKTEIAVALSHRLKLSEEDAIRELVMKSFNSMWFQDLSGSQKEDDRARQNAQRIAMAVGEESMTNSLDIDIFWLSQLLKSNKENTNFKKKIQEIIDALVYLLIERADEADTENGEQEKTAINSEDTSQRKIFPSPDLTAIMSTLYVLCHNFPKLFKNQVMTFVTYLDQDFMQRHKEHATFFVFLFRILDRIIPIMNPPSETNSAHIMQKLQTVLFRNCTLVETAFELCVSCMMSFCSRFDQMENILKILITLFKHCFQQTTLQSARIIKILCYMCRFFDFDDVSVEDYNLPESAPLRLSESILHQIYFQTLRMAGSNDQMISSTSILGLGALLIRKPSFFVEGSFSQILGQLLESEHDVVISSVLELFEKYFEAVEKILLSASEDEQMDNSITMGIIPQYISKILHFLSNPNDSIRERALNVIDITLRQGLYIPQVCIPYVIGLEADTSEVVRKHANALNHQLYERHMNELRSKGPRGMIKAYDLLERRFPSGVRQYTSRTIFHRFYNLLCKYSRSNRNHVIDGFLKSILNVEETNLDRLCFFANVLAYLNFGNLEEVYHVIYVLMRYIDQYSADVAALLRDAKRNMENCDLNSEETKEIILRGAAIFVVVSLTSFLQVTYGAKSTLLGQYEDRNPSKIFERPCVRHVSNTRLTFEHLFKLIEEPDADKFLHFYSLFKKVHEGYMNATTDDAIFNRQVVASRRAIGGQRASRNVVPDSELEPANEETGTAAASDSPVASEVTPRKIGQTPVRKRKRGASERKSTTKRKRKEKEGTGKRSRKKRRVQHGSDDDDDEDFVP
eukprot:CAMPEP_0117437470 /NCGR_PEP_ID=MMETSP0759-20121206/1539_1 /TAXON_ID=63605 /ORGANISM="Percolomonas cosmopolitus, Strain WS" /LENGTH=1850 /DNA_ID=CAMNT_0005229101 /DNA_START=165 /DNA_END=5713 /DNA_ORIENTATION=-